MKSLLAILALVLFGMATSAEARDRHHRRDYDDCDRGYRSSREYRYERYRHYYNNSYRSRSDCGYPVHGPSYRCRGGFMIWFPGVGYVFRSSHYHCD